MTRIEYWNISWWVAIVRSTFQLFTQSFIFILQAFTLGSVTWVINGFAVFLPFCNSHFQDAKNSVGWTAWIGATIFEAGSILGLLEAWNREDMVHFGWDVGKKSHDENGGISGNTDWKYSEQPESKDWIWWSTDKKYWREIGFLATFSQLCAATVFWISGYAP
jgi:hypothetical protein